MAFPSSPLWDGERAVKGPPLPVSFSEVAISKVVPLDSNGLTGSSPIFTCFPTSLPHSRPRMNKISSDKPCFWRWRCYPTRQSRRGAERRRKGPGENGRIGRPMKGFIFVGYTDREREGEAEDRKMHLHVDRQIDYK